MKVDEYLHIFTNVKNYIFLLGVLLAAPVYSAAQARFEVRGGVSFNTIANNALYHQLHASSEAETTTLVGANLAVGFELPLSARVSLQPELQFLQKGGKIEERFLQPNTGTAPVFTQFETSYRVNNLELPLMLNFLVFDGPLDVKLKVGASYGYTLNQQFQGDYMFYRTAEEIFYLDVENLDWDSNLPDGGDFNRHDFSGLAGLGLEATLGKHTLVLDIRYAHDFTDWRTEKSRANEDAQMRHRGIVMTTGVKW